MTPHATSTSPVSPTRGALRPLGLGEVTLTGGFWGERQRVNADATLGHILTWLEREGWIANFDLAAAGEVVTGRRGREFTDSDVFKYLEAVAWELGRRPDPSLQADFDGVVARIGAAQEADGYLNTQFGREGQPDRWSDLEWGHELYCAGHLYQAAVARVRTGHDLRDPLVAIAIRSADLVCEVFGADGIQGLCGHPEVETALAELGRATGDHRYLDQAALFVERRGRHLLADSGWGREYYQDDVTIREASVLRGHAVRANYLSAGAVDVAVETRDPSLLSALESQWTHTIERRTYITGGQGSRHRDEAFGDDWELPADRAYSETCAAVGAIMFSWRLMLAGGGSQYADLIERCLYNVIATSPSPEGTSFFYANTLHRRTPAADAGSDSISHRPASSLRAPWFEVSCCPANVARTIASLAGYVATADARGIQIHQYASATIDTVLDRGRHIVLNVTTDYPRTGMIRIEVREAPGGEWELCLRVPEWADRAELRVIGVDGSTADSRVTPGTATIGRTFVVGDVVELTLPMEPRFTWPDWRIDAVRGTVAVERGPEVLALESIDFARAEDRLDAVEIDVAAGLRERDGETWATIQERSPADAASPDGHRGEPVRLIRYHDWAQRGPSSMRVWIPEHVGRRS